MLSAWFAKQIMGFAGVHYYPAAGASRLIYAGVRDTLLGTAEPLLSILFKMVAQLNKSYHYPQGAGSDTCHGIYFPAN
jgi:hypothetical protein